MTEQTTLDNIYCIVPEHKIKKGWEHRRRRILDFLQRRIDKSYTAKQIAAETGYPMRGSQVEVRKAITLLIEVDEQPIISTSDGFKYTQNKEELKEYMDSLQSRVDGIRRRIEALQTILSQVGCLPPA